MGCKYADRFAFESPNAIASSRGARTPSMPRREVALRHRDRGVANGANRTWTDVNALDFTTRQRTQFSGASVKTQRPAAMVRRRARPSERRFAWGVGLE